MGCILNVWIQLFLLSRMRLQITKYSRFCEPYCQLSCLGKLRRFWLGSCQAVIRKLSGSRQAFIRQLSGSRQAVVRQSSGSRQAVVRQSSGSRLGLKCPSTTSKHNRYLRVQRINEHRNHVLATAKGTYIEIIIHTNSLLICILISDLRNQGLFLNSRKIWF